MKNEKMSKWVMKNWDKIPDKFKVNIKPDKYSLDVPELKLEGHIVVLLIDRQKPSVAASYDFDEERLGINRFGEIIWGFDSGCSCPAPWSDSYPGCYKVAKSWKEFKVDGFDPDFLDEATRKFVEIQNEVIVKPHFVTKVDNNVVITLDYAKNIHKVLEDHVSMAFAMVSQDIKNLVSDDAYNKLLDIYNKYHNANCGPFNRTLKMLIDEAEAKKNETR